MNSVFLRCRWLALAVGFIAVARVTVAYSAAVVSSQAASPAQVPTGTLVTTHLTSAVLRENRIGLKPERSVSVYLPAGYNESGQSYPVVYYFHSFYWSNERMFADGAVVRLLDRAIATGTSRGFILVVADFSSPTTGSFYENSSTSGRWLDFITQELVPFIDRDYRTLAHRESRGLAGDMIGGYGALKLAMLHPEMFNAVYALHPVGTGTGLTPMVERPNWPRTHQAKVFSDLDGDGFSQVFLAMAQAYLPNPDRPPFYCDFMVELEAGVPKVHVEHIRTLQSRFLLDQWLTTHGDNLRQIRGIKFDWGRYDPNQDHVYANQAFTRKLDELGIEHEAEEYRGNTWNKNWTEHGRFWSDLLPFFNRMLEFKSAPPPGIIP